MLCTPYNNVPLLCICLKLNNAYYLKFMDTALTYTYFTFIYRHLKSNLIVTISDFLIVKQLQSKCDLNAQTSKTIKMHIILNIQSIDCGYKA